jgi:hypothetical protein
MTQVSLSEERIEQLKEWKKDIHGGAKLRAKIDGDCQSLEEQVTCVTEELKTFQEWYGGLVSAHKESNPLF